MSLTVTRRAAGLGMLAALAAGLRGHRRRRALRRNAAPGQVMRLENFHDFMPGLVTVPPGQSAMRSH